MLIRLVSVRDAAVQAYMPPAFAPHTGMALREFTDMVRNPESNISKHVEDFELWYLGDFDDQTGTFSVPKDGVQRLARAVDLVMKVH